MNSAYSSQGAAPGPAADDVTWALFDVRTAGLTPETYRLRNSEHGTRQPVFS